MQFRKAPSWWDDLVVPDEAKGAHIATWMSEHLPHPLQHDYVLYTDGSGCVNGWGAQAAIIEAVAGDDGVRRVYDTDLRITGTYGSTVNRSELSAFIDGVHAILTHRLSAVAGLDADEALEKPVGGPLAAFQGSDRVTIMWHTDRQNLAKSLLFGVDGLPLCARSRDRDLWMRYSTMARHVCVSPLCADRNTVDYQKTADHLCSIARLAMLNAKEAFISATSGIIKDQIWKHPKNQKALF